MFSEAVKKVLTLNEEIKGGKVYVYHMTKPDAIKGGILKSGWERYYTGRNSNAYGPGIYTTLYPSRDPRSRTIKYNTDDSTNPRTLKRGANASFDVGRANIYGSAMLKCEASGLNKFVCFDMYASRLIYGSDGKKGFTDVKEQLKKLLDRKTYEEIKKTDEFNDVCFSRSRFTSAYISARALDRLCQYFPEVNAAIDGFICHSESDGFVVIFRNFNNVKPIEVSYDYGRTFKPIKVEEKYSEYKDDNVDLRRALGLDAVHQYNALTGDAVRSFSDLPSGANYLYTDTDRMNKLIKAEKPYDNLPAHFTNGFAKVKKDGKYNYFYLGYFKKGQKNVISPVWFDEAPNTFTSNGLAKVVVNGIPLILVHKKNSNEDRFVVCDNDGDYLCKLSDLDYVMDRKSEENNKEEVNYDDFL